MATGEAFEQWCIVEVMGHHRYAGLVTEQTLGGQAFVRLDVPELPGRPAFCKLFGAGSIYAITPVSESIARAVAEQVGQQPITAWDLPEAMRLRLSAPRAFSADDELEDPPYSDDGEDGEGQC